MEYCYPEQISQSFMWRRLARMAVTGNAHTQNCRHETWTEETTLQTYHVGVDGDTELHVKEA